MPTITMGRTALGSCLFVLVLSAVPPTHAQTATVPEILVVGTYHMGNPGRDVHNLEADDILSTTRQRELEELMDVLGRFRPTKIAVEAQVGSRTIAQRYEAYLSDEYTLTRNEIDQIGFRLAKKLGHPSVHPVDEDGEFPYYRVQNYAKANGLQARFDSISAATGARVKQLADDMRSHTVLETLRLMNSDSSVAEDVGAYYAFVPFGEPYEYAGPGLIASWFERNIRIYHNIRALITSPEDRVLVIYGAGHLGWLRQMAEDDLSVRLRRLSDLVSR
ncbi:MAG TPA: DUF5694 domain-containing protein [Gemmatimonadaceae bacterium]|nr:DUF5694 domain-containing protein [Gemmatimonadaceae bacterium]